MKKSDIRGLAAYTLERFEKLPDIHAEGYLLRHKKSGARIMLLPCSDENKVFNIAFRTPPADSTGVAHIIEHTVLCGSRLFPLKDPFVELVKGSFNTFLNAMTYPDKTMFPVASTNDADFRNLMHVYLDAVFYPNIYKEENIFRQEGWHYHIEKPEDPITYNGVVYNEMKGAFSSPDEVLERMLFSALFPDTPYGVESGGDPACIPSLTYEQFLNFHRTYYHPVNSYIYLYGNLDMIDTLRFIDEEYLSHFDRIEMNSVIPAQKPFSRRKRVEAFYPVSEDEPVRGNTYLSYGVTAGNPLDIKEMIAFDVLDYALLSSPGAPVKQALLDAGIGSDVYASYNDGLLQPYYAITAKEAKTSDEKKFVETIRGKLTELCEKGIDKKSLLAAVNYLEFQFREADFGTWPKGLMYSIDVFDTWLYDDASPWNSLKQLEAYAALREAIGTGYFEELVRSAWLDNPFSCVVVMKPRRGLAQEREAETAEKLAAFKASLSEDEIHALVEKTHALLAFQQAPELPENIEKLPVLARSDIRRKVRPISNIVRKMKAPEGEKLPVTPKIVFHDAETCGIGYLNILYSLEGIPEMDIPYLGILKAMLVNVDTASHGYMDLNNEINAETGGIGVGFTTALREEGEGSSFKPYLSIRTKALYEKMDRAVELIREIIRETQFTDEKRMREILMMMRSQMTAVMQESGHLTAVSRAGAYYSEAAAYTEKLNGISYYRVICNLTDHFEDQKDFLKDKLASLLRAVCDPSGMLVSITCEKKRREDVSKDLYSLVLGCPEVEKSSSGGYPSVLGARNEGFKTAGAVQYVAQAGDFKRAGYTYTGAMQVLRHILSYGYLWQNIRVEGGAYGCSAAFRRTGDVMLTSYRDPNLRRTLEVYRQIPDYLASFEADEREMTKYVIGTISSLDTPLTPSLFGDLSMRSYLSGLTDEAAQKARDEIIDVTVEDIRALADVVRAVLEENYICVVGSESAIEEDKELFGITESLL